jgi:hypothetical protein
MKRRSIITSFLALLFLSACSIFQKDSFGGEWTLKLNGSIQESFNFTVRPNNEFSFSKSINYSGQDYDVTIKGKIENDGQIKANIITGGQVMGDMQGMMTFENGSGTWGASVLSGDWTAMKK